MNYKKKILTIIIITLSAFILSFLFGYLNLDFCYSNSYNCNEIVNDTVLAIVYLSPCIFIPCLLILSFSEKYRKISFYTILILSLIVIPVVFSSPSLCGSLICSKSDNALFLIPFYLIIFIIVFVIFAIYFRIKKPNKY